MTLKQIKPVDPSARVIDPKTGAPLPASGAAVEMTPYWKRRESDGDIEVSEIGQGRMNVSEPRRVKPADEEAK